MKATLLFVACALVLPWVVMVGRAVCLAGPEDRNQTFGLMGGGDASASAECITPADREHAAHAIADYERWFGALSRRDAQSVPKKFTFYPLAGTLYKDLFTNNFVDLDPTSGLLDVDCTELTYNGHDASDVDLRSFGEQIIGVPIFAALDGTVIAAHDGEPDMNTQCIGTANYVIIDHGAGRRCYYWHMKQSSVQVSVGQGVRAGEQIGLAGSSGCSTYPHLHFATYDNGVVVEPYAGPCRPGDSEWVDQTPINRDLYLRDFNIGNVQPNLPFDVPRTGTFVTGFRWTRFWAITGNLPSGSTYRYRYQRPDGTIAYDSGTVAFGNSFLHWSWWWWSYWLNLNQVGTWHILFELNDTLLTAAPFAVVASASEMVNRPPNVVTVGIEPTLPTENDVLVCRVNSDLVLDDPDYDIVRFHYVWTVDSQVVRDIITAAQSDVIPHHTATPESLVECTVTPSDGTEEGAPASALVTMDGYGIPAVSKWGMMVVALFLLTAGTMVLGRSNTESRESGG